MTRDMTQPKTLWFSEFFGIDQPQYELPFVDFNLFSDVPLYVDPFAITKDSSDLAILCHNAITSYFQVLLSAIRSSNKVLTGRLIKGRLSEPNEIHLGVSRRARKGRGIGREQEQQIINALADSRAAKTGVIQSIQELELHISGIGPDKVSDLVINIVLAYLAQFTEDTCEAYGITTRPCAVSGFWDQEREEWSGDYFNLPVHGTDSYILVPKRFVRRDRDLMNHREFYDRYVLEVIQRELLSANDSLVETLKNDQRRVTKKSIRNDTRYALSKNFISDFIISHPEIIDQYRAELQERFTPVDPGFWSGKFNEDDPDIERTLQQLETIQPGREDASRYHDIVFALIQFVFDWALDDFEKEYKMDQGRGKIDIIANNYASGGLFAQLRQEFQARSIPMECKNYVTDLGNSEFNQINDRLGPKSSRIGFTFCRSITNIQAMAKHQTDRWLRQDNLIVLIDDRQLEELVVKRLDRDIKAIEQVLRRMIRNIQYGNSSS